MEQLLGVTAGLLRCQAFFHIPITKKLNIAIWFELMAPHENNMDATQAQKIDCYVIFLEELEDGTFSNRIRL